MRVVLDTHVVGNAKPLLYKSYFLRFKIRKRLGSDRASNMHAFSDPLYASLTKPSSAGHRP